MLNSWIARRRNAFSGNIEKQIEFPVLGWTGNYLTHEIEGLGPNKVEFNSIDLATDPGSLILSGRGESRNIVIKASFAPDWDGDRDYGALRRELYPIFAPGNVIELVLDTDDPGRLFIEGMVESFEPIIWINEPWVTISIMCGDPYFRIANQEIVTNLPSNMAIFQFENPYDVSVGFEMELESIAAGTATTVVTLENRNLAKRTGWTGFARNAGDIYRINTVRGTRGLTRVRSGTTANINGYLSGTLSDMQLVPGVNHFTLSQAATFGSGEIRYQPLYLGI